MKKTILFVFCFCSTLAFGLDRNIAQQFERVMNNSVGVVSTFPEEIRERRSGGALQQKIEVSEDGVLSITVSFPCYPLLDQGKKARVQVATSRKKFVLAEFGGDSKKRYEINRHLNTIAFYDHGVPWVVAFRSSGELDRAARLFAQLIASVGQTALEKVDPSKIAEKAGFRYVVFAPRASNLDDEIRLLRAPEHSSGMVCWLTKSEPTVTVELLSESCNAFPLFFYELSILDEAPFYTVSIPGMASFVQCDLGREYVQSVFSDDKEGLERFFHESLYSGLRFETMPSCKFPSAILSLCSEKKMAQKARARGLEVKTAIIQVRPAYFDPETHQGPFSCWFTGINDNSDDIFRYLFWNKGIAGEASSKVLYKEFPELSTLLKTKSRYRKDLTLEDCLRMRMEALHSFAGGLALFSKRVLAVACYSHELGAPFGPDEELFYNSWPLALGLAEKVGLEEKEKEAVCLLLHDHPPFVGKLNIKKENSSSLLGQEAREASELGISLGEWMSLKMCFELVLSKQFRTVPEGIVAPMKKLKVLSETYQKLLPFGVPFGTSIFKGTLPTRSLFSAYIWEARDSKHREGLSLKRRRDKFEKMLIEKPKSPWKGRFFDWVDKEADKIYRETYLKTDEKRAPYLAIFENGILLSPAYPPEGEVELLFVVDSWGRLFVAPPRDAVSAEEPGFSHASFLAGGPVAAAGEMTLRERRVVLLTGRSAQYPSGPEEMKIVLAGFQKEGIPIDSIRVDISSKE